MKKKLVFVTAPIIILASALGIILIGGNNETNSNTTPESMDTNTIGQSSKNGALGNDVLGGQGGANGSDTTRSGNPRNPSTNGTPPINTKITPTSNKTPQSQTNPPQDTNQTPPNTTTPTPETPPTDPQPTPQPTITYPILLSTYLYVSDGEPYGTDGYIYFRFIQCYAKVQTSATQVQTIKHKTIQLKCGQRQI